MMYLSAVFTTMLCNKLPWNSVIFSISSYICGITNLADLGWDQLVQICSMTFLFFWGQRNSGFGSCHGPNWASLFQASVQVIPLTSHWPKKSWWSSKSGCWVLQSTPECREAGKGDGGGVSGERWPNLPQVVTWIELSLKKGTCTPPFSLLRA